MTVELGCNMRGQKVLCRRFIHDTKAAAKLAQREDDVCNLE